MKILDVIEHKTTITYKQNVFEASQGMTNVNLNFPVSEIFPLQGTSGSNWGIGMGTDEVLVFEGQGRRSGKQAAEEFLDAMRDQGLDQSKGSEIRRFASQRNVTIRDLSGLKNTLSRRAAAASAKNFADLEKLKVGRTLNTILSSPFWKGFFRILGAVAFPVAAYANMIEIINDLENEVEQNPDLEQENYELRNILIGQLSVQVGLVLLIIFKNANLFRRALGAIKWTVRAVQGSVALTGVGALPSLASVLLTESAWLIAGWVISSETVQRGLAEWIQDSMFAGIVAGAGAGVAATVGFLDNALDGAFGTRTLRRELGWDSESADGPEGEVTSSSEWAKLVFHGLLFPPGKEKQLVPYINPGERTRLLEEKFGITQQQSSPPQGNEPSEPGLPANPDAPAVPQ